MRVLGLIPARGGSKGIPGKNTKLLNGKPLLAYTIEAVQESSLLTKCILSTDDPAIAQVGLEWGLEVPFLRPSDLAADNTPTLPVVVHALNHFLSMGEVFDAVCLLQVTTPFRRKGLIDESIQRFVDLDSDSLVSVLPVPHEFNPHWVFEANHNGCLYIATGEKQMVSRRQDLPAAYFRDGALYLTKTKVIVEQQSLYGSTIGYVLGDQEHYVNLDTMQDWNKAEEMIQIIRKRT